MRITEMMSLIAAVQLLAKCNCTVMSLNESHATGETSQAKTAVSDVKHVPGLYDFLLGRNHVYFRRNFIFLENVF